MDTPERRLRPPQRRHWAHHGAWKTRSCTWPKHPGYCDRLRFGNKCLSTFTSSRFGGLFGCPVRIGVVVVECLRGLCAQCVAHRACRRQCSWERWCADLWCPWSCLLLVHAGEMSLVFQAMQSLPRDASHTFKRAQRGLFHGKRRVTGNNVSFSQRKYVLGVCVESVLGCGLWFVLCVCVRTVSPAPAAARCRAGASPHIVFWCWCNCSTLRMGACLVVYVCLRRR